MKKYIIHFKMIHYYSEIEKKPKRKHYQTNYSKNFKYLVSYLYKF